MRDREAWFRAEAARACCHRLHELGAFWPYYRWFWTERQETWDEVRECLAMDIGPRSYGAAVAEFQAERAIDLGPVFDIVARLEFDRSHRRAFGVDRVV